MKGMYGKVGGRNVYMMQAWMHRKGNFYEVCLYTLLLGGYKL
jgi:hypothetical protein